MTTENIQINIREDGSRVVIVNINNIGNAANNAATAVTGLNQALELFKKAWNSISNLANKFFEMADAITLLESRLKLATKSAQDFVKAQEDIYRIAQANNAGLKETGALYVRLNDPVRRLGGGVKETAGIVEAFTASLKIGGATIGESSAAILQFSQALSSGRLMGDEFRSLSENAPRFMQVLADSLNVPTGALKALSSQGKLTSDVIANALLQNLEKLRAEATQVGNTVQGSLSDLSNDLLRTVGYFDKLTGASHTAAESIGGFSILVAQLGNIFKGQLADGAKDVNTQFDTMGFVISSLGPILETFLLFGSDLLALFQNLGRDIGGLGAIAVAASQGNFAGVAAIWDQMRDDQAKADKQLEAFQGRVANLTKDAIKLREQMKAGGETGGFATLKTVATEDELVKIRMKLTGVSESYIKELTVLEKLYEQGTIKIGEYTSLVSELATKTFNSSTAGKELAKQQREAAKIMTQYEQTFVSLISTINEKTEKTRLSAESEEKLTAGEKLASDTMVALRDGTLKLVNVRGMSIDQQKVIIAQKLQELILNEKEQVYQKQALKDAEDLQKGAFKELETITEKVEKQNILNEQIGKSKSEIDALTSSRLLDSAAADEQAASDVRLTATGSDASKALLKYADTIDKVAKKKRELAASYAIGSDLEETKAATDAAKKAAEKYENAFKASSRSIQDGLYSAIIDGGESAFKRLLTDVKGWFARLVLSPIIQPIGDFGAGIVQAAYGASGKGAGVEGGASSISAVTSAYNIYKAIQGGFASLAGTVAEGAQSIINLAGTSSGYYSAAGSGLPVSGLASGIGAAASAGAGVLGGLTIGKGISGQYGNNSAVNGGTAVGAAIGSIVPGLGTALGAVVGGALGGVFNRLFGMGSKNVSSQGIRGNLNSSGATAEGYSNWTQKGGLFRSNKSGTDISTVDVATLNTLNDAFKAVKVTTGDLAKTLGVSSDSLANYSTQFNITLTNDAAKNQEAITKFFTDLGDTLATQLIPNIGEFSKNGETASQTLQRLSEVFTVTDSIATLLGRDVETAFGAVGLASATARQNLIDLAGGADNLASQVSFYVDGFYTDAEKLAPTAEALSKALAELGLSGLKTTTDFKAQVDKLNLANPDDAKLFEKLMQLAPAFKAVADANAAVKEALDKTNKGYQDQIDALLAAREGTEAVRALETKGMDASTVALYDRLKALKIEDDALKTAAENAKKAAEALAETNKSYTDKILDLQRSMMTEIELYNSLTAGMDASTKALYDQLSVVEKQKEVYDYIAERDKEDLSIRTDLTKRLNEALLTQDQLNTNYRATLSSSNQVLFDSVLAAEAHKKAMEDLATVNKGYSDKILEVQRSMMTETELYDSLTAGMDATTKALYDQLQVVEAQKEVYDYISARDKEDLATRTTLTERLNKALLTQDQLNTQYRTTLSSANQALFDSVLAAEAQKKALEDLAAVNKTYQDQIDEELKKRMTATELRDFETKGMDASTIVLYDRLKALQKETQALEDAKEAAEKLAKSLADAVTNALEGVRRSIDAEKTKLKAQYDSDSAIIDARISATNASISDLQSRSQSLGSALASMRQEESAVYWRMTGQRTLKQALTNPGSVSTADLSSALSAVGQDTQDSFTTQSDYLRDFYLTANDIQALGEQTDLQLKVAQDQLAVLQGQKASLDAQYALSVEALDKQMAAAQAQVDMLNGINNNTLPLNQSLAALTLAINAVIANNQTKATVATAVINDAKTSNTTSTGTQSVVTEMSSKEIIDTLNTMAALLAQISDSSDSTAKNIHSVTDGGQYIINQPLSELEAS